MRKIAPWTAALVAGFLFATAGALYADTPALPSSVGSFLLFAEPESGNPLIHVTFNGNIDAIFALDTGDYYDLIGSSLTTRLGLKVQTQATPPQKLGGIQPSHYVIAPFMSIGNIPLNNHPMVVVSDDLLSYPPDLPMDGIIGLGTLSNYAVLFDMSQNQVTFYDASKLAAADISALGFSADSAIPITQDKAAGGCYYVTATLENDGHTTTEPLDIDIGAGTTEITHAAGDALHVKLKDHIDQPTVLSGDVQLRLCTVQKIQIGNLTANNLTLRCQEKNVAGDPPELGRDLLFSGRVLMNFPAGKMYFAAFPAPASPAK